MCSEAIKWQLTHLTVSFSSLLLIISSVTASASAGQNGQEEPSKSETSIAHRIQDGPQTKMKVIKAHSNPHKRPVFNKVFQPENNLDASEYIYIVELDKTPLAQDKTFHKMRNRKARTIENVKLINELRQKVKDEQDKFLQTLSNAIGYKKPINRYEFALNGFSLRMTQEEAKKVAQLKGVSHITRDQIRWLETDRGPTLIGAPSIWDGELPNVLSTQGEGVIVGIIDSGINSDHPSFAQVSGDGFVHTNPFGAGIYVGDCAGQFTRLCNNKLIGVRSYPTITDDYADLDVFPPNLPRNGEDYDGHGSHVAAIAAGNVLLNQTEILPEANTQESDGIPGAFVFEQVSGVAPRANIIAYQACYPGETSDNDTYAGCLTSVINDAIDDAISDGVDVINFSISGGGDPWRDSTERAFLNAFSAGIFVAVSAGNSGPSDSTTVKSSPWYTAVAASEHGRENGFVKELNNFTGGVTPPPVIRGRSNTPGFRAPIVYAGDFTNPNDPNNDPAQCLQPFPAGTFDGEIVVCDRGEIARVQKAENVAAGGAGGYILANIDGGTTFLADDVYVVPGIHIRAQDGNALKSWLETGNGHIATITAGQASQFINDDRVDVVANFSSRGPNRNISTLTPTLTAPGVNIYSAFADQSFGKDGDVPPRAGDFSYLQGTSMSSPHVAGAAALLMAANPSWSADQVRSALSLTATPNMRLDDEVTNTDHFDMGAGRIQVDAATQSGLLMAVSTQEYLAADPASGGDPRALNLPSITDNECRGICTWSRTLVATRDGDWEVEVETISSGLDVSVSPASFRLQEGESQEIEVSINSFGASKVEYSFARLRLTSPVSPDLLLPISVQGSIGDLPTSADVLLRRNNDEFTLENLSTIDIDGLSGTVFGPTEPTFISILLSEDSEPRAILDDLTDGIHLVEFSVPEDAKRLVAKTTASSASDVDLYVFRDENEDGFLSEAEQLAASLTSGVVEEVQINFPEPGNYTIVLQNFSGSNAPQDSVSAHYAIVDNQISSEVTATIPGSVEDGVPFDIGVVYALPNVIETPIQYGALGLSDSVNDLDFLGTINLDFVVGELDTSITGSPTRVAANDVVSLQAIIQENNTAQERSYEISVPMPVGAVFSDFTSQNQGRIENNALKWEVVKSANSTSDTILDFDILIVDDSAPGPITVSLTSELLDREFTSVFNPESFTGIQIEGAPTLSINNGNGLSFEVRETQQLTIPFTTTDPNGDNVILTVSQTSGTTANVQNNENNIIINAPNVTEDETIIFNVTATDAFENQTTSSLSVAVTNNNPPVIDSISAPSTGAAGQSINISFNASDEDGDALNFSINQSQGSSGSFILPNTGTSASFTLSVDDGIDTVTQVVTVTITTPPPSSGSGGGAMQWYLGVFLILISLLRLKRKTV